MDDFTLVGARPQAAPPQHAKEPSHKDLPIVSILLLALIVLGCLLCDVFLTKDPGYMDLSHCSAAPNREFLFGTDTMGRDIFSMIWSGGRLSLVLILIFAVQLRWLPSSGAYDVGKANDAGSRVLHLILPLTVVVLGHLWYYAYMVRNKMLEEMRMDYVLLAKSKGLGRKRILYRHCLRNVLPSYLSIMAISVPHVLGGTYIVESVFSFPGLGTLSYESARYQDYNLLMVLCILSGALVIACNLLAQALSERIDPRMRAQEAIDTWEADTDG